MTKVALLLSHITDGVGNRLPVFAGFLQAAELARISTIPAFTTNTTHSAIGSNVNSNPVTEWQRPEVPGKVDAIAERFSQAAEVMPNPVLLASLTPLAPSVLSTADDGVQLCEVILPSNPDDLVVLDGQHRIKGLAQSSQPDNLVPFVLLADVGAPAYNKSTFARIFAEVTTQSTDLNRLHQAWLSYAFKLDQFEPQGTPPQDTPEALAMETVTGLVAWNPTPPTRNVFFDRIRLNPERPVVAPVHEGFSYDAIGLAAIVKEGYFGNLHRTTALTPTQVGQAMAEAVDSLSSVCTTPLDRSVFFGTVDFRQQPMQDSFLLGVLEALAVTGIPPKWSTMLQNLKFDSANWNFKPWVARLDGNTGGRSRKLASSVLRTALAGGALAPGVTDIPTHLKGDGATLTLSFSKVSSTGRVLPASATQNVFPISRQGVEALSPGTHRLHLRQASTNVSRVVAFDTNSQRDEFTRSRLENAGMELGQPSNDSREIHFIVEYYGGLDETFKLTVNW